MAVTPHTDEAFLREVDEELRRDQLTSFWTRYGRWLVGGIGIAPGGNINYITGHAVFEATHGTAPKYADLDQVNPGSVVLSGEMMLRYLGWTEAADLIIKGMDGAIAKKQVTYDFARLMEGATKVKCSEFASAVIANM